MASSWPHRSASSRNIGGAGDACSSACSVSSSKHCSFNSASVFSVSVHGQGCSQLLGLPAFCSISLRCHMMPPCIFLSYLHGRAMHPCVCSKITEFVVVVFCESILKTVVVTRSTTGSVHAYLRRSLQPRAAVSRPRTQVSAPRSAHPNHPHLDRIDGRSDP